MRLKDLLDDLEMDGWMDEICIIIFGLDCGDVIWILEWTMYLYSFGLV